MNGAGDALVGHGLENLIAILDPNGVNVIDMASMGRLERGDDFLGVAQKLIVKQGVRVALDVADIQMFELDAENGALNAVHPGVPADFGMMVFTVLAVIAQNPDFFGQFLHRRSRQRPLRPTRQGFCRDKS